MFFTLLTATEFVAPTVPAEAEKYFPEATQSFGDGLLEILQKAFQYITPSITEASKICVSLFAIVLLLAILNLIYKRNQNLNQLFGTVAISLILVQPSNTLIQLGIATVEKISDYGKLLLPVMTSALAAEGGVTTSTSLYAATMIFNTVLMSLLSQLLIPVIYCYIVICIVNSAVHNQLLEEISKFIKWLTTWTLKIIIYIFTGYIAITGVVSGTVDASAVKATKLAISGVVPVVGNIISDASESILVSVALIKNTAGVFGMLAIISIWIGPFLQIAIQYIFLKLTAGLCGIYTEQKTSKLIKDFSGILGFLLAATGTMCLLLLVSTFCFMKGLSG